MALKKRTSWSRPIELPIDGVTYQFQVTPETIRQAERLAGRSWREVVADARNGHVGSKVWYAWAALVKHQRAITYEQAAALLDDDAAFELVRLSLREDAAGWPT